MTAFRPWVSKAAQIWNPDTALLAHLSRADHDCRAVHVVDVEFPARIAPVGAPVPDDSPRSQPVSIFSSRFPRSSSLATPSTASRMRLLPRPCPSLPPAQVRPGGLK